MKFFILPLTPKTSEAWSKSLEQDSHWASSANLDNLSDSRDCLTELVEDLRTSDAVLLETAYDEKQNSVKDFLIGIAVGHNIPIYLIGPQVRTVHRLKYFVLCENFEHFRYKQQTGKSGK